MIAKIVRTYADTSVFGGFFDTEFKISTRYFFAQIKKGKFNLVISTVVDEEIKKAPENVRKFYNEIREISKNVDITEEAIHLQQAYLDAGVVTQKWAADALHVAIASVCECSLIVSWNFKHIVNFKKIPLYNGINLSKGYNTIAIHSPLEVYDEEEI